MQTIVLNVQDSVNEKHEATDDDTYLRSIDGMVESITEARKEPIENGVSLDKLSSFTLPAVINY